MHMTCGVARITQDNSRKYSNELNSEVIEHFVTFRGLSANFCGFKDDHGTRSAALVTLVWSRVANSPHFDYSSIVSFIEVSSSLPLSSHLYLL